MAALVRCFSATFCERVYFWLYDIVGDGACADWGLIF
jgi:hypothetical protein